MANRSKKLLVVEVAALGWNLSRSRPGLGGFSFRPAAAAFPAVTCSAQAGFRTASPAARHGMVGNGLFFPELKKVLFWEQSASLVSGPRIWEGLRQRGGRVGMMFWQQSLGEAVDLVLSPRPIHKHEGGMIQDCYSLPEELYDRLAGDAGRRFNLMHYWGPLASRRSSDWIVAATAAVLRAPDLAPDLLLTYLPHLDYDLQRHGPASARAAEALRVLDGQLAALREVAAGAGYDVVVFGDYAIESVSRPPVFPNRALREAGLFRTRSIRGMAYPDFFSSGAFCVVDHAVAHVHAASPAAEARAREVLRGLPGIAEVLDRRAQAALGAGHPRAGDLLLVAETGAWFAYPWWTERREAPDYASHVDIHNKPGYDPCELFFGWPPPSVGMRPEKVRGTHGRADDEARIAWASTLDLGAEPATLLDLASAVRAWCEERR